MFEDKTEIIINIFVMIIGLSIGMVLGYFLFKKYHYKGPDSNIISKKIYTDSSGQKYKFVPKVCVCPISYSMDKLKDSNYIDPNH
jgi:hypothetical protein